MAAIEERHPTKSADAQFVAHEIKCFAAKLRWLGDTEEAARIEQALARVAPAEFVLILSGDTD